MISVDTLEDNKAFALKEHADFPMLSNPDKKVAFAYQVISPDTPPERQFAKLLVLRGRFQETLPEQRLAA